jgi:hypothetical protein
MDNIPLFADCFSCFPRCTIFGHCTFHHHPATNFINTYLLSFEHRKRSSHPPHPTHLLQTSHCKAQRWRSSYPPGPLLQPRRRYLNCFTKGHCLSILFVFIVNSSSTHIEYPAWQRSTLIRMYHHPILNGLRTSESRHPQQKYQITTVHRHYTTVRTFRIPCYFLGLSARKLKMRNGIMASGASPSVPTMHIGACDSMP